MNLSQLRDPFPAADVEWRAARSGVKNGNPWCLVLAYITSRAVMDRLDAVCGPENWQNVYTAGPDGGLLCGISIRWGEEWVTKYDGADNTQVEAVKGGLSGAMKRAAVQWGIGRYLYNLTESFAETSTSNPRGPDWHRAKAKDGQKDVWFAWQTPALPLWALPKGETPAPATKPPMSASTSQEPHGPNSNQIDTAQDLNDRLIQTGEAEDAEAFKGVVSECKKAYGGGKITPLQFADLKKTKDSMQKVLAQ